jgi:hypothetical protein
MNAGKNAPIMLCYPNHWTGPSLQEPINIRRRELRNAKYLYSDDVHPGPLI